MNFLVAYRRQIIAGALALAAVCGAFLLGRNTAPRETEVRVEERVQVLQVEKTVFVERETSLRTADERRTRDEHLRRTVIEVVRPDGGFERRTTEESGAKETEVKTEIQYVDRVVEKVVDRVVEVEVESKVDVRDKTPSPSFHVGLSLGTQPLRLGDDLIRGVPLGPERAVIGVDVGLRVLGPVFLGVYGQTNGVVGTRLSLEF